MAVKAKKTVKQTPTASPAKGPEAHLEMWPISRLVPYIRNPRKNDGAVDRMVGSIKEFGFKTPILAKSDGTLIDGHLRLKGAIKFGLQEVPVLLCDEWTDGQVKSFRLLANRSATWGEFDQELLHLELVDLSEEFGNLDAVTGFDLTEINALMGFAEEKPEKDTAPALTGLIYKIVVTCASEAEQGQTLEQLEGLGLHCQPMIS